MLATWIGFRYAFSRHVIGGVNFLVTMAITSLILGVSLLVLVLSVMNGFEHELKHRILSVAPHIRISNTQALTDEQLSDIDAVLATIPVVESVSQSVEARALMINGASTKALGIAGIQADEYLATRLQDFGLDDYRFPSDGEVTLSYPIAEALNISVGDTVMVLVATEGFMRRKNQVIGLTVASLFHTKTELDQLLAFTTLNTARQLVGIESGVTSLQVFTSDVMQAPLYGTDIYQRLEQRYWVADWTRSQGNLYHAIKTSKSMVLLMLGVIIAVAAVNIVTAMTMVVSNKTKEFAMLMAMGLTSKRLLYIVLAQAVMIAILGIASGVVLGALLSVSIGDLVAQLESFTGYQFLKSDIYPVTYLPSKLQWFDVVAVATPAFFITLIAAVFPALKASRTQPAQALRYDK